MWYWPGKSELDIGVDLVYGVDPGIFFIAFFDIVRWGIFQHFLQYLASEVCALLHVILVE